MVSENTDINNEASSKSKVIEGMLAELEMSKQDLIDLIKALTEQSISSEKMQDVLQEVDANEIKALSLLSDVGENLPQNLSIDELTQHIASGNIEYLEKYLSLDQLKKLSIRVGLVYSLKRAKEFGIILDDKMMSQLTGIPGVGKIMANGSMAIGGKHKHLSTDKAAKLSTDLNTIINQRQVAVGQYQGQQLSSQLNNNPNSLTNPNAAISVVSRVISVVRNQMQNMGLGGSQAVGSSLASQQQQQQTQRIQNLANQTQRVYSNMRRHERRMRQVVPEVGKMSRKGGELTVMVRGATGGEREVNLRDYLRESSKLTPKVERLLNKLTSSATQVSQNLDQLARDLPNAKTFEFDANGRLNVLKESKDKQQFVNISDYLADLRRDIERQKSKLQDKKEELQTKKTDLENKSNTQRAKDLTRGPELDNASLAADAKVALEHEASLKFVTMQGGAKEFNDTKNTEKKESKRTADELVKLDVIADKAKLMESMKASGEMKHIESSMKDVMKHMEEAEKNKDMLKDLQLAKKDRFLDKT